MIKTLSVAAVEFVAAFFRAFGGRSCRFHPSCSAYAREAFERLSWTRALGLAMRRVLRCHPLSRGGSDPVPVN